MNSFQQAHQIAASIIDKHKPIIGYVHGAVEAAIKHDVSPVTIQLALEQMASFLRYGTDGDYKTTHFVVNGKSAFLRVKIIPQLGFSDGQSIAHAMVLTVEGYPFPMTVDLLAAQTELNNAKA